MPTSAKHNCRVMALSAGGSTQRFAHFWPIHRPTSYSALAPTTSAASRTRLCKRIFDIFLHCKHHFRGTCSVLVVLMLKPLLSNFSIKAFSGQTASMERESQQAVLTHFIKPFLSKNDSSGKSRPSAWFWSSLESMWW